MFSEEYLRLHWIIFLNGFIPTLVIKISLSPVEILLYRVVFAAILLYFLIKRRNLEYKFPFKETLVLLSTGLLVFLFWGLIFIAAKISTASVTLVGMATASLWITVLQPIMNKSSSKPFQVLVGINAIVGIFIISNSNFEYGLGLAFAITGAFFGALLTILTGKLVKNYSSHVITFYQMIGALIGTLCFIPIYTQYFANGKGIRWPGLEDFFLILTLAFLFSIYAYTVFISVMKVIPPFTVALVSNLSPIYGMFVALFFLGKEEYMTLGFYIGTGLLLLSVFAYPLLSNYMAEYSKKEH